MILHFVSAKHATSVDECARLKLHSISFRCVLSHVKSGCSERKKVNLTKGVWTETILGSTECSIDKEIAAMNASHLQLRRRDPVLPPFEASVITLMLNNSVVCNLSLMKMMTCIRRNMNRRKTQRSQTKKKMWFPGTTQWHDKMKGILTKCWWRSQSSRTC